MALDIVGPLPKSSVGHQFILVLIDYVTRYSEAIPLRSVMDPRVAKELLKWISWAGLPREILTDQGTNFMSHVLRGSLLGPTYKTAAHLNIPSANKWASGAL